MGKKQVMQVFSFDERAIRTVQKDGQLWFVAADVCAVLEITKHRNAIARLDEDERGPVLVDTLGGEQTHGAVNESGLYSLILTSRKPEAKRFKKWVTSEVLPAIRKTGQYSARDKRRPEIEATNTFRSLHGVARLMGLGRSSAALAANAATINLTGTDLLGLMGVKLSPDEEGGGVSNATLVEGLAQLLGADGMTIKATFKDVLGKLAVVVGPGRADDLPTPHRFRRCLNQARPRLDREGITFVFGRHTNRGHMIRLSRRPQQVELNNAAYI